MSEDVSHETSKKPTWYVYILYSISTGRTYTGITNNPTRRLQQHNSGKGAKATRRGRPWMMVYTEYVPIRSAALKREATIKKMRRAEKLLLAGISA